MRDQSCEGRKLIINCRCKPPLPVAAPPLAAEGSPAEARRCRPTPTAPPAARPRTARAAPGGGNGVRHVVLMCPVHPPSPPSPSPPPYPASSRRRLLTLTPRADPAASTAASCGSLITAHTAQVLQWARASSVAAIPLRCAAHPRQPGMGNRRCGAAWRGGAGGLPGPAPAVTERSCYPPCPGRGGRPACGERSAGPGGGHRPLRISPGPRRA